MRSMRCSSKPRRNGLGNSSRGRKRESPIRKGGRAVNSVAVGHRGEKVTEELVDLGASLAQKLVHAAAGFFGAASDEVLARWALKQLCDEGPSWTPRPPATRRPASVQALRFEMKGGDWGHLVIFAPSHSATAGARLWGSLSKLRGCPSDLQLAQDEY